LWWAPYDDRDGTTPTHALPDYVPNSILYPFIENNKKVFQCPNGLDIEGFWGDAAAPFQVSYTWNVISPRGPSGLDLAKVSNNNGTAYVYLAWEHDSQPACAAVMTNLFTGRITSRTPIFRSEIQPPDSLEKHYPTRHSGMTMFLWCDGHVGPMRFEDLRETFFFFDYAPNEDRPL
jgi:prepilin-type processing-associated H-X9-DG protein